MIVPVEDSRGQWSRVGYYDFHIWGMNAWQCGEYFGKMATIILF